MSANSTGHLPTQDAPPYLVIPSADFGGPVRSVFDPSGDTMHYSHPDSVGVFLDADGQPEDALSAVAAVVWVAQGLGGVFGRDGHAQVFPGQRYAAQVSPARRREFLDVAIADLTRLRDWFAAQPAS